MRITIAFVCSALMFSSLPSVAGDSAYIAPLVLESSLLDIQQADDGFSIVVGERGHVVRIDAQGNANQLAVPSKITLTAVSQIGERIWAVGHDVTILHSADNGQTWQTQLSLPELDRPFLDVLFVDENRGFAVGAYGLFYSTVNGGKDWTKVLHASVLVQDDIDYLDSIKSDIDFYNEELSFILPHFNRIRYHNDILFMAGEAGMLAYSDNFGETWKRIDIDYQGSFFDFSQINDDLIMATGLRGNVFIASGLNENFQRIETCVTTSLNAIVKGSESLSVVGNNGVLLSINDDAVFTNELSPANKEGCASHISVSQQATGLSDAIVNAIVQQDSLLAVTASGLKSFPLKQ